MAQRKSAIVVYLRAVMDAWWLFVAGAVLGLLGVWQWLVDSDVLPAVLGPPSPNPLLFYLVSLGVIFVAPIRAFKRLYDDLENRRLNLIGVHMYMNVTSRSPRVEYDMNTTDDCHLFILPRLTIANRANASGVELDCDLEVEYDEGGRTRTLRAINRTPGDQAENLLRGRIVPSRHVTLAPGQTSEPVDMMWFFYAPGILRGWRKLTLHLHDAVTLKDVAITILPDRDVNAPINTTLTPAS